MSAKRRKDIFDANLELYNLITLFLTSTEICEVLNLLNSDLRDFRDALEMMGEDRRFRYHYYIAGPVASGKSAVLEQLRCFQTYEEWTRPPPPEMYLASDKLGEEQAEKVNSFVFREIREKNAKVHATTAGFHFMDRAPLDLYAFSKDETERRAKTERLMQAVIRDQPLQPGKIMFITAKGETLVERNVGRGRLPAESGTPDYFKKQDALMRSIYNPKLIVKTDNRTIGEIARQLVRHALLNEYEPTDFAPIIERYR